MVKSRSGTRDRRDDAAPVNVAGALPETKESAAKIWKDVDDLPVLDPPDVGLMGVAGCDPGAFTI